MTPGASGPGAIHQVLLATAVAAMLCAVGILHVASKVSAVEAGYKLGQLEDAHRVLERDNASLKLQVATLRSAAHIEVTARQQLGMSAPGSQRVFAVGGPIAPIVPAKPAAKKPAAKAPVAKPKV
jgi:cell division protein FtsL